MKISIERVIIVILLILLIWFGVSIARLENFHYAVQVGFCDNPIENQKDAFRKTMAKEKCLNETQTRTSPLWHLLYGLKVL